MRTGWLTIASLALVVALLGTVGCVTDTPPDVKPPDFNLIFKYGYGFPNKNVLNTFEGTYTKDMIVDPSITVNMSLSEEEMDRIYQKMLEIDFFDYPDEFSVSVPAGELVTMEDPYMGYYFKVEYNTKIKELWWEDNITNKDEKADKLRALIQRIRNIIEAKEEYYKLPAPRGAYF